MAKTSETESTPCLRRLTHWDLLPLKLHFMLSFGAAGGAVPILPVLGKQLGLTASAVGVMYAIQPLVILFSKPALGALTDYTKNIKMIMIAHAIILGLSLGGILFIAPIQQPPPYQGIALGCYNNTSSISISNRYNQSCIEFRLRRNVTCEFRFDSCSNINNSVGTNVTCNQTCGLSGNEIIHFHERDFQEVIESYYSNAEFSNTGVISMYADDPACRCGDSSWKAVSCNANFETCLLENDREKSIYGTYQFWAYSILVILAVSGTGTLFTLSDIACCEILGDRMDLYGNQRLFGTVSWGVVTLAAGYFNEAVKIENSKTDYEPGFFLTFFLLSADIVLLSRMTLKKTSYTPSICKDMGRIFTSAEIVTFIIALFIAGVLSGLVINYELWFLENLGASKFLMGITVFVQCIVAEAPFFYISNFLIRTFGHHFCLVGTFLAFCLRCTLFYYLVNPWLVLPVDLLHGQTFSNMYANMVSFGKLKAPPGTEATMLGLLAGVLEGLGFGAGSLLAGEGFDHMGDRLTFLTAGIFAGACAIIFTIVTLVLKYHEKRKVKNSDSDSTKELCIQTDN